MALLFCLLLDGLVVTDVIYQTGIVGSDPYLAPEVYVQSKYEPQAVDVWSLGIVFCCMSLRRFPWKVPKMTDVSYKYYAAEPTPGTPTVQSLNLRVSSNKSNAELESDMHQREQQQQQQKNREGRDDAQVDGSSKGSGDSQGQSSQSIRGPWRLLRLLPRESRYIIGRMLDTDPETRASLEEINSNPFLSSRTCCKQEESGEVIRAPGHDHTLEPGAGGSSKPAEK